MLELVVIVSPANQPLSLPPSHSSFLPSFLPLPVSLPVSLSFNSFLLSTYYMPSSSGTVLGIGATRLNKTGFAPPSKNLESRRKTPINQMIS